jgi:hypothetical protein
VRGGKSYGKKPRILEDVLLVHGDRINLCTVQKRTPIAVCKNMQIFFKENLFTMTKIVGHKIMLKSNTGIQISLLTHQKYRGRLQMVLQPAK